MTDMILVDIQKAIDTIEPDLLLKKLSAIGFSNHTIGWFKSYLSNRLFRVNLGNCYSDSSNITCGVPQGSILGSLLFLIYVNDMPQAVISNLFLYTNDSCLFFQGQDVIEIEKQLNEDFTNIFEWFVDNRLGIHIGKDKTKSILSASKRKIKRVLKLKVNYKNIQIKQHLKGHILRLHIKNPKNEKKNLNHAK